MKRAAWALLLAGCASPQSAADLVPAFELPKERPAQRSELVLHCSQADAEVWLDGVPQGLCEDFNGEPKGLGLGKGPRRVEVKKRGFRPWESWMEADGTRVVMNVALIPNGGSTP
ncbi:MAG: hypothetical protein AMXMBFR34_30910 [Myxococcaceae bacterium]